MARWTVAICYRTDAVPDVDVVHDIEELEELHEIVERGPSWYAIDRIEIRLTDSDGMKTVQQCEAE